jgi:hypothetical protein
MDKIIENDNLDSFTVYYVSEYLPFSNWSAHRIKIWGKIFPTVEHAYQYKKHCRSDIKFAEKIRSAKSPWLAKKLSMSRDIDAVKWDKLRQGVMYDLLKAKVSQHEDVKSALLETGVLAIVQKGPPEDVYWCVGWKSEGHNVLGKLWMKIRDNL